MSESSKQSVYTGDDAATSPLDDPYNVAIDAVPQEWIDAQHDSPIGAGDGTALPRSTRFTTIPTGTESPYIANVTALGAGFLSGATWYMLAELEVYQGPWIAPIVGAVISLAVLLAGGTDRIYRTVLCLGFYTMTSLVVLMLLTHNQLIEVYGTAEGLQSYEQALLRTRLQNSGQVTAYALGAMTTIMLSFPDRPTS